MQKLAEVVRAQQTISEEGIEIGAQLQDRILLPLSPEPRAELAEKGLSGSWHKIEIKSRLW